MQSYYYSLFLLLLSLVPLHGGDKPVVIITGGSKGIGLATGEYLAQRGMEVYAITRSPFHLMIYKEGFHYETMDVTDPISIEQLITRVIQKEGHIDVLINNAGYALAGPVESLSDEEIERQMDVNFMGPMRMVKAVLPYMRDQGKGRILNISSTQGTYGLPYASAYCASKAALESFSEALSIEVLPWNVFVSIIEPGFVQTHFTVELGTRLVEGDPYHDIMNTIRNSLEERTSGAETLCPAQTPQEVARFIYDVIQEDKPKLRYQTSKEAKAEVGKKLHDLTGEKYTEWMQSTLLR